MKSLFSLLALALSAALLTLTQSGCATEEVYGAPGPVVYRAPVPVYRAPARHAYYGGGYYHGYRHGYRRNYYGSGSYNGWRGGSASWGGGSGSWSGPRGGSGHWHR